MSISQAESLTPPAGAQPVPGRLGALVAELRYRPMAIVGVVLIGLFLVVALCAQWLAPHHPADCSLAGITPGHVPAPSAAHWLGVDTNGCDEASRLIYGARESLLIAVVSLLVGAVVGMAIGLAAGAFGGWVDTVVMRFVDICLAIPGLLLAIGIAATIGASVKAVMIAIAAVNVPMFARMLRGSMLGQRGSDYVLAAYSLGVRRRHVIFRHVLPNSIGPVLVQATLAMATAIIDAAGLAFLGLGGADPRVPEWGRMLTEMQTALSYAPWLALFPGLAIALAALGFTLVGEALREALDPKSRR